MEIDSRSAEPMHLQAARLIKREYIDGAGKGSRLPSLKSLCVRYGIGFGVAQEACRHLREQGLIVSRGGSGNYVDGADSCEGVLRVSFPQFSYFDYIGSFKRLLGEYGQCNPGVRIELKLSHSHDFSGYLEQIDRDGSDIAFVLDSHLGERRELLRPLSAAEAVEAGAGLRNGVEGLFRYGASAYAWPLLFSTNVLICNPEHFERAGMGRPAHDWDMEEFDECCSRLEAGNPGVSAFMMPLSVNRWFNFLLNGGVRLNAFKRGMMPRVELGVFERECVRMRKRLKAMPGMLTEQQLLYALLKGRVSMICGSYMSTLDLLSRHDAGRDDFREFFLRVLPRDRMWTGMPVGAGIGISAGARNPNQAADFCRFAFSPAGQELIRESACGLPVLKSVDVASERELGCFRLNDYVAFRHYRDHVVVRPSRNDGDWERFEREMSLFWCGLRTIDEVRSSLGVDKARMDGL